MKKGQVAYAKSKRGSIVRSQPNTGSQRLAAVPWGQKMGVATGSEACDPDRFTWHEIEFKDLALGWVREDVVTWKPGGTGKPAGNAGLGASQSQIDFVQHIYPHAIKVEKESGVPAIVAMAQTVIESGWGNSKPGNMYFGMKAYGSSYGGWNGQDKQLLTTTEYHAEPNRNYPVLISVNWDQATGKYKYRVKDWFRSYGSIADSFRDYAGLLKGNSRYSNAFFFTHDPDRFIEEVHKGGYATASNYATAVQSIMRTIEGILPMIKKKTRPPKDRPRKTPDPDK